ncbi:hypothetical protein BDC45DRAFT_585988 [Circinella umbellata]|nr:hypothetical protein BDC45DRAFT_585981 [Circinella umbellata]KAI7853846.1 hypothetical protein BDC45DRAFT_585988 [Circinella umbellata]
MYEIRDLNKEDSIFEVESIINPKIGDDKKYIFYVKWKNFDNKDNTWLEGSMKDIWEVDSLNVTKIFHKYRQDSIKGAKERKQLSDGRVLSLSYIFLLSAYTRCPISCLSAHQQHLIYNDLNTKHHYEYLDDLIILAFRKIQKQVIDDLYIKNSSNTLAKQSMKVARDLIDLFTEKEKHPRKGEAKFIIETIKPFLKHLIIKNMDVLTDWMTCHLKPSRHEIDQLTLIPDFVIYTEPYSSKNFEFMFLEVKKQGKQANMYASDLVKLSKEMKIGVEKLVKEGVEEPEEVGIVVEGIEVTIYKLDLKHDGQYRMYVLSRCHLPRKGANDVSLIPTCIECMRQVERIINENINKLQEVLS